MDMALIFPDNVSFLRDTHYGLSALRRILSSAVLQWIPLFFHLYFATPYPAAISTFIKSLWPRQLILKLSQLFQMFSVRRTLSFKTSFFLPLASVYPVLLLSLYRFVQKNLKNGSLTAMKLVYICSAQNKFRFILETLIVKIYFLNSSQKMT
jgi:Sec-independent protein secretion pathway component TatC